MRRKYAMSWNGSHQQGQKMAGVKRLPVACNTLAAVYPPLD
jgi:hypothetical protein